ncbi:13313_t:CDS:2 [Ambispora gerdemannii]|uniref:RNA exonuclease 4 n=1 Tax=Ambispora gerdemannii TaxID=144530 RepID=A0A9N9BG76_9GLOM|nr:13313_t:CDS:2 [Ambispora gerdemannii]
MASHNIFPIDSTIKYFALDCEMVGTGERGLKSALARVSIVDFYGDVVLDEYVKPEQLITDYRTKYSGITKDSLENARCLNSVKKQVADIIKGNIVIGHSIHIDFDVLQLSHPAELTRDISIYNGIRKIFSRVPSLKMLSRKILIKDIQSGAHDSVEDARATMNIYKHFQAEWEECITIYGIEATSREIPTCFRCSSRLHFKNNCPI